MTQKRSAFFSFFFSLLIPLLFLGTQNGCQRVDSKKGPKAGEQIFSVSVSNVVFEELPESLRVQGGFFPSDKLEVKSETEGKVVSVSVNEGDTVNPGDLLATLQPDLLNLQLEKLRSELKEVEARLEAGVSVKNPSIYFRSDVRTESVPVPPPSDKGNKVSLDDVGDDPNYPKEKEEGKINDLPLKVEEQVLERLKAEIALTEKKLEGGTIRTGIGGIVSSKSVTIGSSVQSGEILFQIVKIDPIVFSGYLEKEQIGMIPADKKVPVFVDEVTDQSFSGEIFFVSPELDSQKKSYEVKLTVSNTQSRIRVGMKGAMSIPLQRMKRLLVVPQSSIVDREGKKMVYVLKGAWAEQRTVEVGTQNGDKVEIIKGLKEGETVVSKGNEGFQRDFEWVKVESQ